MRKLTLDVAKYSDFADQKEALIAGKYEVVKVSRENVEVPYGSYIKDVRISPREYARREGMEVEEFTSKRGNRTLRIGSRTYPASDLDRDIIKVGEELIQRTKSIEIVYVDLKEV